MFPLTYNFCSIFNSCQIIDFFNYCYKYTYLYDIYTYLYDESIHCCSYVYMFRTNQLGLYSCHELNEIGKYRLKYLNIWIPIGGCLERTRSYDLLESDMA